MSKPGQHVYDFPPFRVDAGERVLLRDGKPVPLTLKAFETLLLLIENAGHIVEKEELMKAVWRGTAVEENNLSQSISALRKAFGQSAHGPSYIQTVARRGFRFVEPVEEHWGTNTGPKVYIRRRKLAAGLRRAPQKGQKVSSLR